MAGGRCRQKYAPAWSSRRRVVFSRSVLSVHYYSGETGEAGCLIDARKLTYEVKGTASGFFILNFFF